jgi:hypothetical protein
LFASLPGYFYSTSSEGVYVHLYHSGAYAGSGVRITQKTEYPWGDSVELIVAPAEPREFTLFLRVPGWSPSATVTVNGQELPARPGTYLPIRRRWSAGDRVKLALTCGPSF